MSDRARTHPEHEAEQAYIDAAYERLEEIRREASDRADLRAGQRESTFQGAYERDVEVRAALLRAASLDVGGHSLVFGRTDDEDGERYYIGRRAVFDAAHEPVVIDWRVPAAEPFYRATGRHPLGLTQRRHFLCQGRHLTSIQDERFGAGLEDLGSVGSDALREAMARPRTGQMRDIVATVQAEQDEVIRDELSGVLAVQGGPGTGKTAVALHRAAYLLFSNREKLGRQGMLVIGPTHRFLRYIDQVLPALGEGGVRLATLADLAGIDVAHDDEPEAVAAIKGQVRMAEVIARAVRLHQRAPAATMTLQVDDVSVKLRARELSALVAAASRSPRSHNARASMMLTILVDRLYRRYVTKAKRSRGAIGHMARGEAQRQLREDPTLLALMAEIWPLVDARALIARLLSDRDMLAEAATGILEPEEIETVLRAVDAPWTTADAPLVDEAFALLGPAAYRRKVATVDDDGEDEVDTVGHVIVDEAQDLSAMALRMVSRRSRTGSITLVGDLAQAIGATTPASWDEIIAHLPQVEPIRTRELTVNYRTPASIMEVAGRVLAEAAPDLTPPRSAQEGGRPVTFVDGDPVAIATEHVAAHRRSGTGTIAIIAPHEMLPRLAGLADEDDDDVAVLPVEEAKGLEFDEVVVVEPATIVAGSSHGARALYVALTRATKGVTVAHAAELPAVLAPSRNPQPAGT